jgi:hypothetical protein
MNSATAMLPVQPDLLLAGAFGSGKGKSFVDLESKGIIRIVRLGLQCTGVMPRLTLQEYHHVRIQPK